MTTGPTDREITRAQRLARLAVRANRGLADACPYDANGTPAERILAARFVRAYVAAGGTVDGIDLGDGPQEPEPVDELAGRWHRYETSDGATGRLAVTGEPGNRTVLVTRPGKLGSK